LVPGFRYQKIAWPLVNNLVDVFTKSFIILSPKIHAMTRNIVEDSFSRISRKEYLNPKIKATTRELSIHSRNKYQTVYIYMVGVVRRNMA
jgi:hypothetical protein